jgi:hypothetical protein
MQRGQKDYLGIMKLTLSSYEGTMWTPAPLPPDLLENFTFDLGTDTRLYFWGHLAPTEQKPCRPFPWPTRRPTGRGAA